LHITHALFEGVTFLGDRESLEEIELTESDLEVIERRCNAATKGPWESFVEGRDHESGDSFIRTGGPDTESPDIDLIVSVEDQDFIAHARQDVPRLLLEVRRLRRLLKQ
jgi:hypothetical protein